MCYFSWKIDHASINFHEYQQTIRIGLLVGVISRVYAIWIGCNVERFWMKVSISNWRLVSLVYLISRSR